MIQIYGRFDGQWSHSQISRGIVRGLVAHGLPVRIYNAWASTIADPDAPVYEDLEDLQDKIEVGINPDAQVGLFVGGYPPQIGSWLEGHLLRLAVLITESEVLPADWVEMVNTKVDCVLAPSKWVASVYRSAGVTARIMIVRHGVHDEYLAPLPQYERTTLPLRFGHISGARDFPWRKGTPQLVKAFRQVFEPGEAQLVIRTPESPAAWGWQTKDLITVYWSDRIYQFSQREMRAWYEGLHYLIQPSRAEAFGICPLEARARGVPVVLTEATGHHDHVTARDLLVNYGGKTDIRVNGIPNGRAPDVSVEHIAHALRWARREVAHRRTDTYAMAAGGYARKWTWPAVTYALADGLKRVLGGSARSLDDKLGLG